MKREIKFVIPPGTDPSRCRGCQAQIFWIKTEAGKNMPLDPDGIPHWATCPKADQFRSPPDDFQKKQRDEQATMIAEVNRRSYRLTPWERNFISIAESEIAKGRPLTRERESKLLEIYEAKA